MIFALFLPTIAVAQTSSSPINPDITETVFRYQFLHNGSAQQTNASVYFIRLPGGDPSAEFMDRFKGSDPRVKKASQARTDTETITDKETGQKGLVFYIMTCTMRGTNKATVAGGYLEGGESSAHNTYFLEKKAGKWTVLSHTTGAES